MKVFTIGFTRKSAAQFFERLDQPGLVRLVDVRLNNVSQLAGFTKKEDLRFFLRRILDLDYVHLPELAPSAGILQEYQGKSRDWQSYERQFMALMAERKIEHIIPKELVDGGCLLCSEPVPDRCHRRLVAEYLLTRWDGLEIVHL